MAWRTMTPGTQMRGLSIRHRGLRNGDQNGCGRQLGRPRTLSATSWSEGVGRAAVSGFVRLVD